MYCFEDCRVFVILNLVGCVSYSFCDCKRSESSLLEFLTFR